MARIQVLDQTTIDKIAAGEVIERPSAVVKELVENAIDAGATSIVVEIKEGGIAFIRITDNGKGIPRDEISKAFLRHATSKIRAIEDLDSVRSLGFRGEALSSIASVAQVEVHTKVAEDEVGCTYTIHGGMEISLEPTAVNNGTTFLVRQLFYNIPARRKFLKSASTEASHINELVIRLALSHPDIAFQFINNGNLKLHTSGNGSLKDIIYSIYGRDVANNLLEVNMVNGPVKLSGYIGKPFISRGNRNYENYFVNGRYVKNQSVSKALEDAYKGYTMQHRYPFTVLHMEIDTQIIDVNVHPTKMELRFTEQNAIYNSIYVSIQDVLSGRNLMLDVELPEVKKPVEEKILEKTPLENKDLDKKTVDIPEKTVISDLKLEREAEIIKEDERFTYNNIISKPHKNTNRYGSSLTPKEDAENLDYFMDKMKERVSSYHQGMSSAEVASTTEIFRKENPIIQDKIKSAIVEAKQMNMFEEHMLTAKPQQQYRLIGNVFATYWLIEYKEELYIIDQHAAHEKVLYENTIKNWKNKSFDIQYISPPIVLTLSMQEKELLENNLERFTEIGFELEVFGGDSYAIRGVPANLYSIAKRELFIDMLDELSTNMQVNTPTERIVEKIASMSCKAAVKGNTNISATEVEHLISQLLELDNPFHCPHGRPTIIAISKKEMEKKFKRIL